MLWYLATPVNPIDSETIESNLNRTVSVWLALLRSGLWVDAPYVGLCRALDDARAADRRLGMSIGLELLGRCDGLILAGPRLSSGMQLELNQALEKRLRIVDAVGMATEAVVEAVNVVECLAEFTESTTEVLEETIKRRST